MKKISLRLLLIFIILFPPILNAYENETEEIADFIVKSMDKIASRKRVVVLDFINENGNVDKLGKFLADEVSLKLLKKASGFDVLDRNEMKSIIGKSEVGLKVPYNQKEIKELGNKTKVGAIVTGNIEIYKDFITLTVNLISTYSGKVVGTKKVDIAIKRDEETKENQSGKNIKKIIEHNNLVFELKGCRQLDRETMCAFSVTSNKNNTWKFHLSKTSSLYDNMGRNYKIREMSLGGISKEVYYDVYTNLVPGISESGVIYFEKVPDDVLNVDFTVVLTDDEQIVYKASFKHVELIK